MVHNASPYRVLEGNLPNPKSEIDPRVVMRHLRAGKSPKEIAKLVGYTDWCLWKFIKRHQDVRDVYERTYHDRYPHREEPPARIKLREAVQ
jgi:hypothetical protein